MRELLKQVDTMNKKVLFLIPMFLICLLLCISVYINQKHNIHTSNITKQKIKSLIDDLDKNNEYIDVNGEKVVMSYHAYRELRDIGEPVMPILIEELNNNRSTRVRTYLLSIGCYINEKNNAMLLEYLPVPVKYMKDNESEIRQASISIMGTMAIRFKFQGNPEYFEKVVPYLIEAMKDKERYIQSIAGKDLFDCGRRDLVPEDLIKEYKMETTF
jgi:hypothetical protein